MIFANPSRRGLGATNPVFDLLNIPAQLVGNWLNNPMVDPNSPEGLAAQARRRQIANSLSPSTIAANVYEKVRYGDIPSPGDGISNPPAPPAPDLSNMISFTPNDLYKQAASSFEGWKSQVQQDIQSAEDGGSYTPNNGGGMSWWLIGVLGVGAIVLLNRI